MLSVLTGEHDGEHAVGHGFVGRVFRAGGEGRILAIDLPEDPLPIDLHCAEVVLAPGVVLGGEAIEVAYRRCGFPQEALTSRLTPSGPRDALQIEGNVCAPIHNAEIVSLYLYPN